MSRIGKKEIVLSSGVSAEVKDRTVVVSGPKGQLSFSLSKNIDVEKKDDKLVVLGKSQDKSTMALWGTTRQIIANMIVGVDKGWFKTLEVVGTGYRPALEGSKLILSVGFSHKLEVLPPQGITFAVAENKIHISGFDKDLVGRTAAKIRQLRPPDSYKGKGIRYLGEKLKLKPGKAAKVGPGAGGK